MVCDEPKMPSDWDDHDGWEAYFKSLPSDDFWYNIATIDPGSFSFDRLGALIEELRERNRTTLWFPGCGFSPLPRAFASHGFTVYATDISPTAIQYQDNNKSVVQPLLDGISVAGSRSTEGHLEAQLHDFRTEFGNHNVDAIFNIKSIQGLPIDSMRSALRSHFTALRPGGIAFFDTINVQGTARDQLEQSLVETGFYVPLQKLNQWYRNALAATDIPHVFILGAPMITQTDDYPHQHGSPEYNRDSKILRNITDEYRSRMDTERKKEQQSVNEHTKHAQVIYSTG